MTTMTGWFHSLASQESNYFKYDELEHGAGECKCHREENQHTDIVDLADTNVWVRVLVCVTCMHVCVVCMLLYVMCVCVLVCV